VPRICKINKIQVFRVSIVYITKDKIGNNMNFDERVDKLISAGESLLTTIKSPMGGVVTMPSADASLFSEWKTNSLFFLEQAFGVNSPYYVEFSTKVTQAYSGKINRGLGSLRAAKENLGYISVTADTSSNTNTKDIIQNIANRFHSTVRAFRNRYSCRQPLTVSDEYDVQYIYGALLQLFFDDIRPEECTPSYAGKASRIDFLLKNERTVIEIKKTRDGLKDKELGSQLIDDIERYRSHPDCDFLVCFVYDPDGFISNPRGVEADLSRERDGLDVLVQIMPK
jgi:hypothetical protein